MVFKDQGKLKEAELHTRKAIELKPNFAVAHGNLGNILSDLGKLDEAILIYEKAIDIDEKFDSAQAGLGNALLKKGNHSDGLYKIKRANGSISFNLKDGFSIN